eukprot:4161509-Alexandrium_andersonii.AAC.2
MEERCLILQRADVGMTLRVRLACDRIRDGLLALQASAGKAPADSWRQINHVPQDPVASLNHLGIQRPLAIEVA